MGNLVTVQTNAGELAKMIDELNILVDKINNFEVTFGDVSSVKTEDYSSAFDLEHQK